MIQTIHFYGERGLVNGTLLDLKAKGRLAQLIRNIHFSFRSPSHLNISDESDITVIVEAGFAEFGWPDAIIVADTPDRHRLVLFVEAKVGRYVDEAQDYRVRDRGFNSSINGQFSLRYRLAHALQSFQRGQPRLIETASLAAAYGGAPRRLAKRQNLDHIVTPYLLGASEYLFVALTDDLTDVWEQIETHHEHLLPFLAAPIKDGAIAAEWCHSRNQWQQHRHAFGWIGFREIEALVVDGEYFPLSRHFLQAKRAGPVACGCAHDDVRKVRTVNWGRYRSDSGTIVLRDRLRSVINSTAAVTGGFLAFEPGNGSDSVIGRAGRRLLKLITPIAPWNDAVLLLGVNVNCEAMPESLGHRNRQLMKFKETVFAVVPLWEADLRQNEIDDAVRDTVANLAENS